MCISSVWKKLLTCFREWTWKDAVLPRASRLILDWDSICVSQAGDRGGRWRQRCCTERQSTWNGQGAGSVPAQWNNCLGSELSCVEENADFHCRSQKGISNTVGILLLVNCLSCKHLSWRRILCRCSLGNAAIWIQELSLDYFLKNFSSLSLLSWAIFQTL